MSDSNRRPFRLPERNPFALTSYIFRYKRQFTWHSIGGILCNTVVVAGPIMLGRVLDAAAGLEKEGASAQGIRNLAIQCLLFIAVTVLFQFSRYLKRWYMQDLGNRMTNDMRAGLFSSLMDCPAERLEKQSVGDLMTRTIGDVDQIVGTIRSTITEVWDTWLLMLSYFVVLIYYSPTIALICTIPVPFALLAAELVRHPLYRVTLQARKASSRVTSHLHRTINGMHILRLFGREETERERLKEYCEDQVKWSIRSSLFQGGMLPIYTIIASIGVFVVMLWGSKSVISGNWSIGQFTAFLSMFIAMTGRTQKAAQVMNQFHAARASWDRIKEKIALGAPESGAGVKVEDVDKAVHEAAVSVEASALRTGSRFVVKNLTFRYPKAAADSLHGISFVADPGNLIGITGSVGSGKSALATALTGLYPYEGSVTFGGRELREITSDARVSAIAYAGQDSFLFSSTMAENITLLAKEHIVMDERLERAIRVSALVDDLPLFPDGLDTVIGEKGVRLSGGQRQRICLARALYTGCPILLLDDPFSAVDIGTERRMIERLRQEFAGTTILLFSHRLAAFTNADRIMVLENGSVKENGTHRELLAKQGVYERIFSAQHWMEDEQVEIA